MIRRVVHRLFPFLRDDEAELDALLDKLHREEIDRSSAQEDLREKSRSLEIREEYIEISQSEIRAEKERLRSAQQALEKAKEQQALKEAKRLVEKLKAKLNPEVRAAYEKDYRFGFQQGLRAGREKAGRT